MRHAMDVLFHGRPDVPGVLDVHHLCQRPARAHATFAPPTNTGGAHEAQHRPHPHHPRGQPGPPARAARHDEGARRTAGPTTTSCSTARSRDAVADRVRQQVECGIDIVTDGEMSKVSFLGYVKDRLGGFEVDMGESRMAPSWQDEVDDFPEYYAEYFKKYSSTVTPAAPHHLQRARSATSARSCCRPTSTTSRRRPPPYDVADVFMPSTGPSGFGRNEYYAIARGVPPRGRRGDARGVPGHRRRRVHPAGRRPVPDRHAERPDDGEEGARAAGRGSTSRR